MENNYFDKVAASWDTNDIHSQRTKAIAAGILKTLINDAKNGKALEFGSGTGILSFALQEFFDEILLMDGSAEMVKVANEKIEKSGLNHLKSLQMDIDAGEKPTETFDYIFTQMAMHHVKNIDSAISGFYELLSTNGKIAIADLYTEDGTFHDWNFDGHFGFDPDEFSRKMLEAGFKNVSYTECFVIPKVREDKSVKSFPIFLLTAEK